ncbi:MAG: thioredoxin [Lachnoclostridium sp.]|nr:thioredoxin [Lachnoclostridium sp.]
MAAIHLTKETFKQEVLESGIPVLVDFWAPWCGPCQMVLPIIEELGNELTDVKICKVNVDEQPELAREYRVMSIPTLMVFENGKMVKREMGAKPKNELLAMLGK